MDLKPDTVRYIAWALIEGVQYMHNAGITHRDLKPDNILFDELLVPRIADLGIANNPHRKSGTIRYFAPEQCHDHIKFDQKKADLWGLGLLLYLLVKKKEAFEKCEERDSATRDLKCFDVEVIQEKNEDEGLLALTQILLSINPQDRDLKKGLQQVSWYKQIRYAANEHYDFKDPVPITKPIGWPN